MTDQTPIFIRPNRGQAVFGIHRATLYRWAEAGHIKLIKRGSQTFVEVAALRRYIENGAGGLIGGLDDHADGTMQQNQQLGA